MKDVLSIIICSRQPNVSDVLIQNISNTVGCVYEILVIDNSKNEYNVFSAYNEGVNRSSGNILCFMHEDILFHTDEWGRLVINLFQNRQLGLLGVIGTHFMAKYASPWWAASMSSGQLMQGNSVTGKYLSDEERLWGRRKSDSIEVVVVDGLWFCIRRDMFDNGLIRFDDRTFSGFHCYDADICMQVIRAGLQVRVAYDIMIEHKSMGNIDSYYFSQLDLWYEKWKSYLPMFRGVEMSDFEIEEREMVCRNFSSFFRINELQEELLSDIKKTKAYRLGSFILKPFRKIDKWFLL